MSDEMTNQIPAHTRVVSALLEQELRVAALKGVLVWMDERGEYSGFVDGLRERAVEQAFPFPIVSHRGSFLQTILALEGFVDGQDARPAILHITGVHDGSHGDEESASERPPFTIEQTPLLEYERMGKRFVRQLPALIEQAAAGKVSPRELHDFIASRQADDALTLQAADAWLEAHALVARSGLDKRFLSIDPDTLIELLFEPDESLKVDYDADILWPHLHRLLGLDERWRAFVHQPPMGINERHDPRANVLAIAYTVTAWCLCVEYVHDLKRDPIVEQLQPLKNLSKPLIESCRLIAEHLRQAHPDRYEQIVSEFEPRLQPEIEQGNARELGKVDTFQFEQRRIFEEALRAMDSGEFELVREWADARQSQHSFWVRRKPQHDAAWRLVERAARLGMLIAAHPRPLAHAMGLEEAVELYVEHAAPIDRAHRLLEQRRKSLLDVCISINGFARLREQLDQLRRRYRTWADALAVTFNALCMEHGFTPTESLQQRHLFDQEVRPDALHNERGAVAFFMVDALRFEMAQELMHDLSELDGVTMTLKPRLCELPSVTAVGMNALAPIAPQGTLQPIIEGHAFKGFKTHEFQVTRPKDRQRAMQHRVGGRICPWLTLEDVLEQPASSLKGTVTKSNLIIVHSQELDEAGEKGLGLATFERTLRDLHAAVRLLREAGVEHVVMTSDHGYLLLDHTTAHDRLLSHAGSKTDADRRHLVYPVHTSQDGRVTVSLAALGYTGVEGFLMLPEDTSIFDRGARNQLFVHGGNAPQERVIPVLHARFKPLSPAKKKLVPLTELSLTLTPSEGLMGLHAVTARATQEQSQGALLFGKATHVDLAMRVALPDTDGTEPPVHVDVEIADVRGEGAELKGSVVRAPLEQDVEIFFTLSSDRPLPRLPVELYAPSRAAEEVIPARSTQRYAVTARHPVKAIEPVEPSPRIAVEEPVEVVDSEDESLVEEVSVPPVIEPLAAEEGLGGELSEIEYAGWEDLPRDGSQQIFEHLARHGSITEAEATTMLGSAKQFRRFSRRIDEYISRVSFDVRVEVVGATKRYVKQDNQ